ncbi:MAG: AraC family transcriptional regulator [Aquabacterium sp.]|uniref:helix-turn-helix transcriptional regulator n=1 Tax=Aquabacterium sp. TaxID=1872578 RepID=UPI001208BDDB|nr:AraC family transcriptional regulator [Aquabacterium sp.]TAK89989.1 MAG: AraC family transcriptional regulator [Aquabacterium sp.]
MHAPVDWLKPSLHPVYARLICAELRRRGFSEEEIVQGTRLNWAELHGSNLFLSFEQIRRLILRALELTQCPWLGLQVGQITQLSTHGALGYAGMAASNVGEVMMLLQRFTDVRLRLARFDIDTRGGFALVLTEVLTSPDVREYLMGNYVAGFLRLLETITGQDLLDRVTVHWPFDEPPWSQKYRDFCPRSDFGAEQLRIDMPPELLHCPSLAPDPETYRTALRDCERQLQQIQLGTVTVRVQRRLLGCDGSYPSLEQMAEMEHVSVRTLIRHLREEGMTYQRLLDGVREELACWLLVHTSLSVEAIAEKLGYQDTSNFSRTFRRWLGVTPRDFRQSRVDHSLATTPPG